MPLELADNSESSSRTLGTELAASQNDGVTRDQHAPVRTRARHRLRCYQLPVGVLGHPTSFLSAYGLGTGVGRGLGVGSNRGVGVGLGVAEGVPLGVTVAVAVAVGVADAVVLAVAVAVGVAVGVTLAVGVGVGPPLGDTRTK